MPRPPRVQYADALYHVTARGVQRAAIFIDDRDRAALLSIAADTFRRLDARAFAWCLMGNHYHFVLQTHLPNLSELMHRLNSVYSLTFNRRHARVGHVFEARFKAILVDRDAYLLSVCRYVDLNPVRAGLVRSPAAWPWSSYRSHAGLVRGPNWLATSEVHGMLTDDGNRAKAAESYRSWVRQGRDLPLWPGALREGWCLGDTEFLQQAMRNATPACAPAEESASGIASRRRGWAASTGKGSSGTRRCQTPPKAAR